MQYQHPDLETVGIDETIAFNGAQHAPVSGEWKALETNRESARLDTE
jgi:hypothetical protein